MMHRNRGAAARSCEGVGEAGSWPGCEEPELGRRIAAWRSDPQWRGLWRRLRSLEPWTLRQQLTLTEIPAPTGFEALRAEWMLRQWRALDIQASLDEAGNVIAELPGTEPRAPWLALTAHLDTAFPPGTPVRLVRTTNRILAPGISDNGCGLAALLALGRLLQASPPSRRGSIALIANVGEEGEGNLRGMRHLFRAGSRWAQSIGATVVLDGPGCDQITTVGLPSRRLRVVFQGPGGHSWSELGRASAVHAAVRTATALLAQVEPQTGEIGCNIASVQGGTTINAIASDAELKLDLRARDVAPLEAMEQAVRRALAQGLQEENAAALSGAVRGRIELLGERPAGQLAETSPLLALVRQVDAGLGIVAQLRSASTDANLPLSQGREALCLGAGGSGGGAHTRGEWFNPSGRTLGLERIVLLALCAADLLPEIAAVTTATVHPCNAVPGSERPMLAPGS